MKMQNILHKYWFLGVVALLCCASGAFADTVNMTLTSPGSNVLGGVYVNPYTASINGVSVLVICDDWADESFTNESWTATKTNLNPLGSGVKWNGTTVGTVTLGAQQEYNAMAWLATQLLNNPNKNCPPGANCVGDISYAIWQLTNPSANPFSRLTGSDLSNARSWLTAALGEENYKSSGWEILTPITATASCPGYPNNKCPSAPPQEFIAITHVPEPSSLMLLGLSALGFLGARRKLLR